MFLSCSCSELWVVHTQSSPFYPSISRSLCTTRLSPVPFCTSKQLYYSHPAGIWECGYVWYLMHDLLLYKVSWLVLSEWKGVYRRLINDNLSQDLPYKIVISHWTHINYKSFSLTGSISGERKSAAILWSINRVSWSHSREVVSYLAGGASSGVRKWGLGDCKVRLHRAWNATDWYHYCSATCITTQFSAIK